MAKYSLLKVTVSQLYVSNNPIELRSDDMEILDLIER